MKVYEFDFANSLGDTIMEKYESLFLILNQANNDNHIRTMIASPECLSIFETATSGFHATVTYAMIGNLLFAGKLIYGNNRINIDCFRAEYMKKDEFLLLGETGNAVIKVTNFLI